MNTPGLFPFVDDNRNSLNRRLEHVLAGARITPKIGRRWIAAASLFALAAIAGVGFAQQGKRSLAAAPEIAEIAKPQGVHEPERAGVAAREPEKRTKALATAQTSSAFPG